MNRIGEVNKPSVSSRERERKKETRHWECSVAHMYDKRTAQARLAVRSSSCLVPQLGAQHGLRPHEMHDRTHRNGGVINDMANIHKDQVNPDVSPRPLTLMLSVIGRLPLLVPSML